MKNRLNKLITAVAVAFAASAALVPTTAPAVNLSADELGDAAVAPFYTVRDGWQTLINITNTSSAPVLVLVRVHESHNNRGVLDVLVALAGFDQFVGLLRQSGGFFAPEFVATDQPNTEGLRSCTLPTTLSNFEGSSQSGGSPGIGLSTAGITGDNYDGGQRSTDRLYEGYVEYIVLGHAQGNKTGAIVDAAGVINIGNAIEQGDCINVRNALFGGDNPRTETRSIVETARQFGEPINAVKFEQRLLNGSRGIEAASPVTTWANFYNPGNGSGVANGRGPFANPNLVTPADNANCSIARSDSRDGFAEWLPGGENGSCNNLIVAAANRAPRDPSLNDAFPAVAMQVDENSNSAQFLTPSIQSQAADSRRRGIDALSATIQRSTLINSFAEGTRRQGDIRTDWIVTLPTKGFYVDRASEPENFSGGSVFGSNNRAAVHDNDLGFGQQFAITDGRPSSYLMGAASSAEEPSGLDVPHAPFAQSFGPSSYANGPDTGPIPFGMAGGRSCDSVGLALYDRAAQKSGPPPEPPFNFPNAPPPPEPTTADFCYAVNVINFNGNTALGRNSTNNGPPRNRININTTGLENPNFGWLFVDLTDGGNSRPLVVNRTSVRNAQGDRSTEIGVGLMGLPAIGFSLQQRNFGSVSANYASSVSHSYLSEQRPAGFDE